jgi:hypothetical protein
MSNFDKIKPLQEKIDSLLLKIKKIKPNLYREYLLIVDNAINDFINLEEEYIKDNPQEFKLFLSKLNDIIKILNFITTKENIKESLRDWFKKEDWVRIDTQGNITGPCGTMKKGGATTRCLPRKKAQSLTKAERAKTSQKKAAASRKGKQFVPNTDKAKYKKGTYNKK